MATSGSGYKFGTFQGVFVPSILTVLGVIMYLRFGWVLGSVGLPATLVIVTMSVAITLLTGLSISAMATNMPVGGGGAYYMISRTLGLEAGAAVGLPLFLAQALGIAFYIAGFSETVVSFFPALSPVFVGLVTLAALTALAYLSADLALKSQYVILTVLALSLVSFFLGGGDLAGAPLGEAIPPGSFWVAFAVFFPAVTGIEAGLGMSGDLKNPARALPLGTLAAVLTGYAVYIAIPVFLAETVADREALLGDALIMTRVARWSWLVVLGILGASLSSAMGTLLAAPRTLQALAQDGVLPRAIGRGYGKGNDPRAATVIAFAIALAGIALGDLNAIAPVLSMFFLTSYAVLNFSAGIEALIGSPAWRPSFRVPWWLSILGGVACVAAMLMINAGATIVAILISALVFHLIQRRQLAARWGDVRYGLLVLVARAAIEALSRRRPDARSWNPNLLVLTGSPSSRWHLVLIGQALAGETGLLTVATVVPEDIGDKPGRLDKLRDTITQYLDDNKVSALVKIQTDRSVTDGLVSLVKSYGFGPLVPNTIVLGKAAMPEDPDRHAELLSLVQRRGRNLIVVHEAEDIEDVSEARRIDIWWKGHRGNLGLMLALAFLLRKHPVWEDAEIVLRRLVKEEREVAAATAQLRDQLADARFEARVEVIATEKDPFEVIRQKSRQADLVFMGLRPRAADEPVAAYSTYYADLGRKTEGMPPTALVVAAEGVDLHQLFARPWRLHERMRAATSDEEET